MIQFSYNHILVLLFAVLSPSVNRESKEFLLNLAHDPAQYIQVGQEFAVVPSAIEDIIATEVCRLPEPVEREYAIPNSI